MNRIDTLFAKKKNNILSIYFTAGHPTLESPATIVETLSESGVDMIEIGIPFSDPIADGPVIQLSSHHALENGMSVKILFDQLIDIRQKVSIPLILMGYLNPVIQYGVESFCKKCAEIGIDGVILPDLPLDIYIEEYKAIFEKYGLYNIFLITPQTGEERIRQLEQHSKGFIYMVAVSATTGMRNSFESYQDDYFKRIEAMKLKVPRIIGFGISDHDTYVHACKNAEGAIIGSAFVKTLGQAGDLKANIRSFIGQIKM